MVFGVFSFFYFPHSCFVVAATVYFVIGDCQVGHCRVVLLLHGGDSQDVWINQHQETFTVLLRG